MNEQSGRVYRAATMGSIRVDASKVNVPVRVIGGADDRIISPKLVRWVGQQARSCTSPA